MTSFAVLNASRDGVPCKPGPIITAARRIRRAAGSRHAVIFAGAGDMAAALVFEDMTSLGFKS
jgi:hypothetical protein